MRVLSCNDPEAYGERAYATFTVDGAGGRRISATTGGLMIIEAAALAQRAAAMRNDGLQPQQDAATLASLAKEARLCRDLLAELRRIARNCTRYGVTDQPLFGGHDEHEPQGLVNILDGCVSVAEASFSILRKQWQDAVAREAGL